MALDYSGLEHPILVMALEPAQELAQARYWHRKGYETTARVLFYKERYGRYLQFLTPISVWQE